MSQPRLHGSVSRGEGSGDVERFRRLAVVARAFVVAGLLAALPGCVTERTPRVVGAPAIGATSGSAAPPTPANLPAQPVASPAGTAESRSSAARVAVEPIAVLPYDGMTLPVISPDGALLLTMTSDGGGPGVVARPVLYDLTASPPTVVSIDATAMAGRSLAAVQDAGAFVFGGSAEAPGSGARLDFASRRASIVVAAPPTIPGGLSDEEWSRLRAVDPSFVRDEALASVSVAPTSVRGGDMPGILILSLTRGRMVAIDPRTLATVPLAVGSVAGCWAADAAGGSPAVLLTTRDGLVLQRLTRDSAGWRAGEPTRLLRDPWVPRATSNPQRPFILIGPGPKDRPEMLQIVAMQLVP